MRIHRIKAILLQEFFITKRSLEVMMDIFFFSLMSLIAFGFVNIFLSGEFKSISSYYLLLGVMLWEIIRITQYSLSVGSLWNIWSRNLSNLFITPLLVEEFFIAHMLSGIIKTLFTFALISIIAIVLFQFNIFLIGIVNLLLIFINLTIFAWSIGFIILGFIFKFGTRIQSLAWGLIFIFQPLTAAFFPLKILPPFLRNIANLLPPTHVFEAARNALVNPSVDWRLLGLAFIENIFYLILSLWVFNFLFNKSKESGQFARNEG